MVFQLMSRPQRATHVERITLMFAKNVGTIDRALRIVAGIALLGAFFAFPDATWRYWALIGVVPLATGLFSTCPAYSLIGVSTCGRKAA